MDLEDVVPNFPPHQLATDRDVEHLNMPNNVHPPTDYEFESPPILVKNVHGQPEIDIINAFRKYEFSSLQKHRGEAIEGVILPASIYPPTWDHYKEVRKTILLAARKVGIELVCKTTNADKNNKKGGSGKCFVLACTYNIPSKAFEKKVIEYEMAPPRVSEFDIPLPHYNYSNRQDAIIGQKSRNRKQKVKAGEVPGDRSKRTICAKRNEPTPAQGGRRCPFTISVYLVEGNCWYVKYKDKHKIMHCGHMRVSRGELPSKKNRVDDGAKETIKMAYPNMRNGHGMRNFVSKLTGGENLSRSTIETIAHEGMDMSQTDAAHVLQWLKDEVEENRMRSLALFHDVTETSLLLITRAQRREELLKEKIVIAEEKKAAREAAELANKKKPKKKRKVGTKAQAKKRPGKKGPPVKRTPAKKPSEITLSKEELRELAGDIVKHEDINLFFRNVVGDDEWAGKKLFEKMERMLDLGETLDKVEQQLTVGQQVLLGVAWCREDERTLFEKYPQVMMFDVTMESNRERRPLGVMGAVDCNMEVFTPVRVIMPSQKAWVFDWIFKNVIPTLMGKEPLKRTAIILTDGDRTMYSQVDANLEKHYPNAKHALCMFHLVTKGLEKLKNRFVGLDRKTVYAHLRTFKETIYTWFRMGGIETLEEFKISESFLKQWLSDLQQNVDDEVDPDVSRNAQVLQDFLRNNILPHKERFLVCNRNWLMTLDYRTTSPLEAMFKAMKKGCIPKVVPEMSLLTSIQLQDAQREAAMSERKRVAMAMYQSQSMWCMGSQTGDQVRVRCTFVTITNEDKSSLLLCIRDHHECAHIRSFGTPS